MKGWWNCTRFITMTHPCFERACTIAPGCLKSRDGWLKISADMTFAVKQRSGFLKVDFLVGVNSLKATQPVHSTVAQADIRGLDTAVLGSVMWACLTLIARVSVGACCRLALLRIAHGTGLRRLQGISWSSDGFVTPFRRSSGRLKWCHACNVPEEAGQFTGHAHHGDIGMLAVCGESAETAAQA